MGIFGGGGSAAPQLPGGEGLASPAGEETRQEEDPRHPGGQVGADGLPPAAQAGGLRGAPLPRAVDVARPSSASLFGGLPKETPPAVDRFRRAARPAAAGPS